MPETPGASIITKVAIDQTDESKGFRTRCGFRKAFDAGPAKKSFYDIVFPYDVDLLAGDFYVPAGKSPFNRLWLEIAPNTDLALLAPGAGLSSSVVAADTEISVNPFAKAALDAMLKVNGETQNEEVFVRLVSIPADPTDFSALKKVRWDSANSKLKSADGSQLGLSGQTGEKIFITVRFEDGSYISPGQHVEIGHETLGSSSLGAGVPLRFVILNEDNAQLDIGFNLTYLHD